MRELSSLGSLCCNEPLLLRHITPELAATGPNDLPPTLGLKGSFMCALQREQVKFGPKIILNTPPTLSCQEVFSPRFGRLSMHSLFVVGLYAR